MGAINYGTQTKIFDYRYPAKGRDFSKLLRGIMKPGIYSGFTVTKTGDNTVSVSSGVLVIQTSTDKCIVLRTTTAFTLTVVDSAPVIYAKFDWADASGNYVDFLKRADTGKLTNEVQLCTVNFAGGVITTIDTADKDYGMFDSDFNMILSGELSVDTINEKTSGSGVTIDGSLIKDGVAKFDTINEKTTDNGVDIEGVHFEDSVQKIDTINEKTGAAGVTVDGTNIKDGILTDDGSDGVGVQTVDGSILRTKIIEIGDWDMDATSAVHIAHGLGDNWKKIRIVDNIIRNDADTEYFNISRFINDVDPNLIAGGFSQIDITNISLSRRQGGPFDDVNFNATSYNRGWITIQYID